MFQTPAGMTAVATEDDTSWTYSNDYDCDYDFEPSSLPPDARPNAQAPLSPTVAPSWPVSSLPSNAHDASETYHDNDEENDPSFVSHEPCAPDHAPHSIETEPLPASVHDASETYHEDCEIDSASVSHESRAPIVLPESIEMPPRSLPLHVPHGVVGAEPSDDTFETNVQDSKDSAPLCASHEPCHAAVLQGDLFPTVDSMAIATNAPLESPPHPVKMTAPRDPRHRVDCDLNGPSRDSPTPMAMDNTPMPLELSQSPMDCDASWASSDSHCSAHEHATVPAVESVRPPLPMDCDASWTSNDSRSTANGQDNGSALEPTTSSTASLQSDVAQESPLELPWNDAVNRHTATVYDTSDTTRTGLEAPVSPILETGLAQSSPPDATFETSKHGKDDFEPSGVESTPQSPPTISSLVTSSQTVTAPEMAHDGNDETPKSPGAPVDLHSPVKIEASIHPVTEQSPANNDASWTSSHDMEPWSPIPHLQPVPPPAQQPLTILAPVTDASPAAKQVAPLGAAPSRAPQLKISEMESPDWLEPSPFQAPPHVKSLPVVSFLPTLPLTDLPPSRVQPQKLSELESPSWPEPSPFQAPPPVKSLPVVSFLPTLPLTDMPPILVHDTQEDTGMHAYDNVEQLSPVFQPSVPLIPPPALSLDAATAAPTTDVLPALEQDGHRSPASDRSVESYAIQPPLPLQPPELFQALSQSPRPVPPSLDSFATPGTRARPLVDGTDDVSSTYSNECDYSVEQLSPEPMSHQSTAASMAKILASRVTDTVEVDQTGVGQPDDTPHLSLLQAPLPSSIDSFLPTKPRSTDPRPPPDGTAPDDTSWTYSNECDYDFPVQQPESIKVLPLETNPLSHPSKDEPMTSIQSFRPTLQPAVAERPPPSTTNDDDASWTYSNEYDCDYDFEQPSPVKQSEPTQLRANSSLLAISTKRTVVSRDPSQPGAHEEYISPYETYLDPSTNKPLLVLPMTVSPTNPPRRSKKWLLLLLAVVGMAAVAGSICGTGHCSNLINPSAPASTSLRTSDSTTSPVTMTPVSPSPSLRPTAATIATTAAPSRAETWEPTARPTSTRPTLSPTPLNESALETLAPTYTLVNLTLAPAYTVNGTITAPSAVMDATVQPPRAPPDPKTPTVLAPATNARPTSRPVSQSPKSTPTLSPNPPNGPTAPLDRRSAISSLLGSVQSTTLHPLALDWVTSVDPLQLIPDSATNTTRLIQRYALVTLYYQLGGDNWTKNQGWLSLASECNWYNVDCFDLTDHQVQEIRLTDNGLVGTLPPEIGLLSQLKLVDLASNDITGPLPESMGNWRDVHSVYINHNQLSGPVPATLAQWTALRMLWVAGNELVGTLPESLQAWNRLEKADFGSNQFSGPLPVWIGQWSNLEFIDWSHNNFVGPLPSDMGRWTNVQTVSLAHTDVTGTIPAELGDRWTNLQHVHLDGTLLTGSIPTAWCDRGVNVTVECGTLNCTCCANCQANVAHNIFAN